jgi:hypothetical protein
MRRRTILSSHFGWLVPVKRWCLKTFPASIRAGLWPDHLMLHAPELSWGTYELKNGVSCNCRSLLFLETYYNCLKVQATCSISATRLEEMFF